MQPTTKARSAIHSIPSSNNLTGSDRLAASPFRNDPNLPYCFPNESFAQSAGSFSAEGSAAALCGSRITRGKNVDSLPVTQEF